MVYYFSTRSVEIRNKIVVSYSGLAYLHAGRLWRKFEKQATFEEICSAAFDGLIEAVESYDPRRSAKFETFCQQRIAVSVTDFVIGLRTPEDKATILVECSRSTKLVLRVQIGEFTSEDDTAEQLSNLIMALNAYHVAAGGGGLTIDEWQILTPANDTVEVQS